MADLWLHITINTRHRGHFFSEVFVKFVFVLQPPAEAGCFNHLYLTFYWFHVWPFELFMHIQSQNVFHLTITMYVPFSFAQIQIAQWPSETLHERSQRLVFKLKCLKMSAAI